MRPRHAWIVAGAVALSACLSGPKPASATYDFGPPATGAVRLAIKALAGIEVSAPRWLDSVNTHYRLAYANAARPMAYAQTRWVMPPPTLIEVRLKERAVDGGTILGGTGPVLRIELDEFTQVFDAEKSSRAVLRARATLANGREVLRQRAFVFQEPAVTADGAGGAAAMARAADRLVEAALAWAGEQ